MEYLEIGRIKKPYGLQGEIRMTIDDRFWKDLLEADVLFVEIKGQKIPFFIEEIKDGTDVLVKFEEVDDKEAASQLSNKSLFIRSSDVRSETASQLSFEAQLPEFIGYTVWTDEHGLIGSIIDLVEMPMQILALVQKNEKELLIPMVEEFIQHIIGSEKKIIMSLPEGMLDL